jgi:deoxycytidine triphosphate deaminase
MMIHIQASDTQSSLTNVKPEDVQPNAVDLRLDKVFAIRPVLFTIGEDENGKETKAHRGSLEMYPDKDGYFYLNPGSYEVVMENIINVGADEAGWVITRSTLNRNGLFITSGLYDSGYHGVMAGALHVIGAAAKIKRGTRVGQFLLFTSQSVKKYDGDYGIGKEHDKKYT